MEAVIMDTISGLRKRAYVYIREMALKAIIVGRTPIEDDVADTADILGGTFGLKDNLRGLKNGDENPSEQVVTAFKTLMGPTIVPDETDRFLVRPFE